MFEYKVITLKDIVDGHIYELSAEYTAEQFVSSNGTISYCKRVPTGIQIKFPQITHDVKVGGVLMFNQKKDD